MDAFRNKVVVITGGADGIGRSLTQKFLQLGATVITNDNNKRKLEELKDILSREGKQCAIFKADVSNNDEVQEFSKYVRQNYGKVDMLINNAGVSIAQIPASDIPLDLSEWIFKINYWGAIYCVNNFMPMINSNGGSKIINICSIYSHFGVYLRSVYCASKSALKAYSSVLR